MGQYIYTLHCKVSISEYVNYVNYIGTCVQIYTHRSASEDGDISTVHSQFLDS